MQTIQSNAIAYLRPDQVEEMEGERESLTRKLNNPGIQDKGAVSDQLRRLDHQLEKQRPQPFPSDEIDAAVRREKELREQWLPGMLSMEETRKNGSGAVDRHRAWEQRNKKKIFEWQNLRRRLYAGDEGRDNASIELFRPTTNTMNIDNAQIQGKQFFLPPEGAAPGVTFSAPQLAQLGAMGLADTVALMSNEQRQKLKDMLLGAYAAKAAAPKPEPQAPFRGKLKVYHKRELTPAHKAAMAAGRARAAAAKAGA